MRRKAVGWELMCSRTYQHLTDTPMPTVLENGREQKKGREEGGKGFLNRLSVVVRFDELGYKEVGSSSSYAWIWS